MPTVEPQKPRFAHVKWFYDTDPSGAGFFCPRLEQKKRDYFSLKILRPAEAEAVYQCRPGSKIGSIFVEADFRYFDAPATLTMGVTDPIVRAYVLGKNGIIAQGWDTAMSAQSDADWSVCVTVMLVPCEEFHRASDAAVLGTCDQHYDVYVLDVYRKRLDIGDLTTAVREQALKWNPEKIVIEKKASGASVMQALANSGLPIEGVVPQENKRDRAINGGAGAGSVQGWFKAGRVLFPSVQPPLQVDWLPDLTRELKDFTGEKGGTDDQVDALVHVVSYGIREGSMAIRFPDNWQSDAQIDANMRAQQNGLPDLDIFNDPTQLVRDGIINDPFGECCGRCKKFDKQKRPTCTLHGWMVTALHPRCDDFDDGVTVTMFPRH